MSVSVLIRITVLDLEPNPCFQIFLNISETTTTNTTTTTTTTTNNNNNRFTQAHNSLTVNVLGALWFTTETVIYSSKRCVLISCWAMKKLIQVEVTEYATTPGGAVIQSLSLALETWHAIKWSNDRIFNCNTSKRSSGQELPVIFFELRAPTCLWGRYDPKTENFTLFYSTPFFISSTSTPFQKHFTSLYRATLELHFMFWLLRCTLWLERIMSPNLKLPSLLKHYRKSP